MLDAKYQMRTIWAIGYLHHPHCRLFCLGGALALPVHPVSDRGVNAIDIPLIVT